MNEVKEVLPVRTHLKRKFLSELGLPFNPNADELKVRLFPQASIVYQDAVFVAVFENLRIVGFIPDPKITLHEAE
jgi:hypothetical protein